MFFTPLQKAFTHSRSAQAQRARKGPGRKLRSRKLRCEPLEDRRMLSLSSVGGTLFDDLDADGVQGGGEAGLANWTVVLERTDTPNPLLTILNPQPDDPSDAFAASVATLGNNIIVGASKEPVGGLPAVGTAYLIDGETGETLLQFDHPEPVAWDKCGFAVTAVGNNVLVGTRRDLSTPDHVAVTGAAYLFDGATGDLLQTFYDPNPESDPQPATNDWFSGLRSSVAPFGQDVLIGAPADDTTANEAGIVYLFNHQDGSVQRQFENPTPDASDNFGFGIASDGQSVLVGADAGIVYLFDSTTGALLRTFHNPTPEDGDSFGRWMAVDGDTILISARSDNTGAPQAGAAYLFDASTGELLRTLLNPTPEDGDRFGVWGGFLTNHQVALGSNGDNTAGPKAGAVYVLEPVQTRRSDAAGNYDFTNLDPGTYQVREIVQAGYTQTSPGGDGTHSVTLAAGENVAGLDFGNRFESIELFADSFENGQWDGLWVEDSQNDWYGER